MNCSKYKSLTRDIECWSCKTIIKNNYAIYMCVDNSFCSTHCRDKHFNHIRNIDPELNYPEKWNTNTNTKVNCFIEIDYYKVPNSRKQITKMYRSQSLYNLSETEKEKLIITGIKLYKFDLNLIFSSKRNKIVIICFICLILSIIIKINK